MSTQSATKPISTLHFTLATAGHVDHGKTSVLRALTGTDPDRLKEEKERQMTIDLGFAHFRTTSADLSTIAPALVPAFNSRKESSGDDGELVVGFVDVPGHGKFLKNMLAGVGGIDMALLVVAADEGVMPQTIQHVKILTLLGVRECILVVNKTDLAEPEQVELATEEAEELLTRFGIEVMETVPFTCADDSRTNSLKGAIVKHVLNLPPRDRQHDVLGRELPSFLSIDRVFSKAGYGAVVTGTLTRGTIKVGDEISIQPGDISGRVRGLQTFNNKLETAFPGQRLAINIALKESKPIERGHAVVGTDVAPVSTLIVQLTDLGGLESSREIKGDSLKPQNVRFYHGTAERYAVLRWLMPIEVDEDGDNGEITRDIADLRHAIVGQISLSEPVVANPGEKFIIRHGDFGIAGGEIILTARPRWLSRAMLKGLSEMVWRGDLESAAAELINLSPQRSLSESTVNAILPDTQRLNIINQLTQKGKIEKLGDQLITMEEKADLVEKILGALTDAAALGGRDSALSQEGLKVKIAPLVDRSVFQSIVRDLLASNRIVKIEEKLALPTAAKSQSTIDPVMAATMEKVLTVLQSNFCLEISEIATQTGRKQQDVVDALTQLEKEKKAAIVNYEFAANADSMLKAHKALQLVWQKQRNISPGDFREAVGTSRKYAMALLSYFDDHQITRRLPSGRVLLKNPGV